MSVFAPPEYLALEDARDELMRRMYEGVRPLEELRPFRLEDFNLVDTVEGTAAANTLRAAIFSGELSLYAVFSFRAEPLWLYDRELVYAALYRGAVVLSFAYIDQHYRAPFGLDSSDLKELTRDPLCLKEKPFQAWLRNEASKKTWPCQLVGVVRRQPGRPPRLREEVIEVLQEMSLRGELSSSTPDKEVLARVQDSRPSLRNVSNDTYRRARKQANLIIGS